MDSATTSEHIQPDYANSAADVCQDAMTYMLRIEIGKPDLRFLFLEYPLAFMVQEYPLAFMVQDLTPGLPSWVPGHQPGGRLVQLFDRVWSLPN